MKDILKLKKVDVGSWTTNFLITDLDHKNKENSMSAHSFFHHLGLLAGKELHGIEGLEFSVELKECKLNIFDPLNLCENH